MPAFNFQAQWAEQVWIGAHHASGKYAAVGNLLPKRTTIRRAGRAEVGQTLYLYTGQRTKASRKLGEALCLAVTPVQILRDVDARDVDALVLGSQVLNSHEVERLARLDTAGLWGAAELLRFLRTMYPKGRDLALYCW